MDSPILKWDMSTDAKNRFQSKIKNIMANSADPDETARDEPFHLDLHCLHWYLFWSARMPTGIIFMLYSSR